MKTTVDLPEELLRAWKRRAAEEGTTLKVMWESLLTAALRPRRPRRSKRKIHWVTAPGGLPAGLDISSREQMWEWFRTHK